MGVFPGLITCDFSPNLISAIKHVYGEDVIQIDGFHVMQELNRGIKSDLLKFREKRFNSERRELRSLRNWINSIQKELREGNAFLNSLENRGAPPEVDSSHEMSSCCARLTSEIIEILKINVPDRFFRELQGCIERQNRLFEENLFRFTESLLKAMPKQHFTEKGMIRVKKEALKKLKTCYIGFRKPLDEKSVQFYHDFSVIFLQPDDLTAKQEEKLEIFLHTYPELRKYRTMTLMVGEIYSFL